MKKIIFLLLSSIYFLGCSGSGGYFENKYPDKEKRIEWIDSHFIMINESSEKILMCSPKYWFMTQDAFYEAKKISEDPELPKKTRDYAKYVLAFGYYSAGLYDLCANIQENLLKDVDESWKIKLLKDMQNNYDAMGDYEKDLLVTKEKIKVQGRTELRDLNEMAICYLNLGMYQDCIDAVNKIPLNSESAITRVTSASAYGYLKEYKNARNELQKAIQNNSKRAEQDLTELESKGDSAYWTEDYLKLVQRNKPYNLLEQKKLMDNPILQFSKYTPKRYFDEVFALYGGALHNLESSAYSEAPGLPGPLSDCSFLFTVIEGVPFLTVQTSFEKKDTLKKKISEYRKYIECSLNVYMINENTAILYYHDWQGEIIKKALIKN